MESAVAPCATVARCRISVALEDRRGRGAFLESFRSLAFFPLVGVELGFDDPNGEQWSSEIVSAVHHVPTGIWHVELESWVTNEFDLAVMVVKMGPEWRVLGDPRRPAA